MGIAEENNSGGCDAVPFTGCTTRCAAPGEGARLLSQLPPPSSHRQDTAGHGWIVKSCASKPKEFWW